MLFIALASLLAFIALTANKNTDSTLLSEIDKKIVQQIIIHRDKQNIVLKKIHGQWWMTEPHEIRAHDFRIRSLLALVNARTDSYYDIQNIDLKTYGLQQPRAHIQFDHTHIYFGKANPVNGMRYIRVNNKMHLLFDLLYPLIRSQPSSFVDLSLLPQGSKINSLSLPDIQLVKKNREWKIKPEQGSSSDQIQSLLQNWSYAKAFAVHSTMQRKSLGHINIEFDQLPAIEFQITDTSPWLILARTDMNIEYHLDESQKHQLLHINTP
jgi:hypothetical protein